MLELTIILALYALLMVALVQGPRLAVRAWQWARARWERRTLRRIARERLAHFCATEEPR